ncbi:MAG: tol-pal system-associated acyl-CoA thioesterase [Hyphomicrobiales bacterium]|nr:tol-pal system-associated acyl-CoA thioesterase [Hyphomicrobiales bacterium]MDE2018644.1 tol-pal system-associated acyl-CoA thioesterase [Hyphomicrobiales bacterium]
MEPPMDDAHRLEIRVYYEDTDFSGVVYHASHLRFMERGRTEFLRRLGLDQATLFAEGLAFAVRSLAIDYLAPARMDDLLVVETKIAAAGGASLDMSQRIMRGGATLAEAAVKVTCLRGGKPTRLPPVLRQNPPGNAPLRVTRR